MRLLHVCALGALAATAVACSHDTSGTLVTPDPVAGLRYINAVPDTSGLDFRVVDVVTDAPNTVNAVFRTGGAPYGISTAFMPPYFAVLAGTRHLRVFPNSSNPDVSSQVVFDTSFTFVQGVNYTMYLYGYARTASTPHLQALITTDTLPTGTSLTGKVAVRVLNLIPPTAGGPSPAGNVDLWSTKVSAAAPFAGAATFANLGYGGITGYVTVNVDTLKISATDAGTATPALFAGNYDLGTAGTSTADPIPGSSVAGSGFTAILVPQSVTGSLAPQTGAYTAPAVLFVTDIKPPRTAP